MLDVKGVSDREVYVGIRPEGFIPDSNGAFECGLSSIEVMGRDVSVVSTHESSINPVIRAIINADDTPPMAEKGRYSLKPHKVFLFSTEDETRIRF